MRRCARRSSGTRSGWRIETSSGSRSKSGAVKVATQSTVSWASTEGVVERRSQRKQLGAPGRPREAADAHAHGVDRATAEDRDELVAGLLDRQPALDDGPVDRRRARPRSRSPGSRARGAGRRGGRGSRSTRRSTGVGGAHGRTGRWSTPNRSLERMHGGHLVSDRADAADARHDVDDLVGRAPDDEPLEVARRLEDREVRLGSPRRRGR